MPVHSRSKNGVASLAYVAGISINLALCLLNRDGRDKPGHDVAENIEGKTTPRWLTCARLSPLP
jgi:hypothetical protein